MLIRASEQKCDFVFGHKYHNTKKDFEDSPNMMSVSREDIFKQAFRHTSYMDAKSMNPQDAIIKTDTFILGDCSTIAHPTFKHSTQPYYTSCDLIRFDDNGEVHVYFVKASNPNKFEKEKREYHKIIAYFEFVAKNNTFLRTFYDDSRVFYHFALSDKFVLITEPVKPVSLPDVIDKEGNFVFKPESKLTRQCSKCEYANSCELRNCKHEKFNIFDLDGRDWRKIDKYIKDNKTIEVDELDDKFVASLNPVSQNRYELYQQGSTFVYDEMELYSFIETIFGQKVLHFDYETYIDLKTFKQTPFSYSNHVVDKGNKIKSHKFDIVLDKPLTSEYNRFVDEMAEVLDNNLPIVVYNQTFEQGVFRYLAEMYPKCKDIFMSAVERTVDLWDIFNKGMCLHIDMKKTGLKDAHKALCGDEYNNMAVNNGVDASLAYQRMMSSGEIDPKVIADIRLYNTQDTLSQIQVIDALLELLKF